VSPNPIGARAEHLAQAVAERVVNLVLEAIDIDAVVQKIDIDAVVRRVDINDIVSRVDIDAIVQHIDINAVVERVDINSIVKQLDIDSLVEQTELGSIIARSTTGVMTEVLDVVRSQGVGLDDFLARWVNRLLRRKVDSLPVGPVLLVDAPDGSTS
jgi:hypothetical protein